MNIANKQAQELGIGEYAKLSIAENAEPNLFVHDLDHRKIDSAFKDLPLTSINEGVRASLEQFLEMAKDGILNYSVSG